MTTAKEDRIIVLREFGSEFNANLALNLGQAEIAVHMLN